jgi:hypothetical protein
MGIETALGVGASLIGGAMSSSAASNAADAQRAAAAESAAAQREGADKSIAAQREMFDIGRADLAPYRQGGTTAQNQLLQLLGIGGDQNAQGYGRYAQDFTMPEFTGDPGYQFRLKSGMDALNRSAAARGMGISGANIKGATEYGQNFGSNEYNNAYNRALGTFQTNRANQLDPLFKLYAGGQSAAAGSAVQAGNLGQNLGQTYTGLGQGLGQAAVAGGNAQASGYINQANAINNALSQGMSSYASRSRSPYNNFLGTSSPYSYGAGGYTGEGPFMP